MPPVFLIFICRNMFFWNNWLNFPLWSQTFTELGEIRIGKWQKGRIIELLVISPSFKRCTARYAELSSFHRHLLAIEQGVFGSPGRNWVACCNLSTSKTYLVYYVIYQKIKTVKLDVFSPLNLVLHFDIFYVNHQDRNIQWTSHLSNTTAATNVLFFLSNMREKYQIAV